MAFEKIAVQLLRLQKQIIQRHDIPGIYAPANYPMPKFENSTPQKPPRLRQPEKEP